MASLYEKISVLGPSAQYDTCGPKDFGLTTNIPGVYKANFGNGQTCRLFKVLQNNACVNNCKYCAFRRDRDCKREVATPTEMAYAFDSAWKRRLVDGLFLSSGLVGSADATVEKMVDTVKILREKMMYKGYVHLKLMPGSSRAAVEQVMGIANRVSLNIEAPTEESLGQLSPQKSLKHGFFDTLDTLKSEVLKLRQSGKKVPSLTTQFVVGAGGESDREIIMKTDLLYKKYGLSRVFYSAFRPVIGTPLEKMPAASLTREHRLYQTDFLMRFYDFKAEEIPVDKQGNLSDGADPKLIWAKSNLAYFPINLNKASFNQLLRVPGIGPTGAKKIVEIRKREKIRGLNYLRGIRLQLSKMRNFIYF